jgi:hypothetical protein
MFCKAHCGHTRIIQAGFYQWVGIRNWLKIGQGFKSGSKLICAGIT